MLGIKPGQLGPEVSKLTIVLSWPPPPFCWPQVKAPDEGERKGFWFLNYPLKRRRKTFEWMFLKPKRKKAKRGHPGLASFFLSFWCHPLQVISYLFHFKFKASHDWIYNKADFFITRSDQNQSQHWRQFFSGDQLFILITGFYFCKNLSVVGCKPHDEEVMGSNPIFSFGYESRNKPLIYEQYYWIS